jgi:uncharacterized protein
VPLTIFQSSQHRDRLRDLGEWVAENGIDGGGPFRAVRDLLIGRAPRAGQAPGHPLREPGETDSAAARRVALLLDRTVLPIQGPPGAGKTFSGARMIVTLLAAGHPVGITGTSHKVIGNLLGEVLKAADEEQVAVRPIQHAEPHQRLDDDRVVRAKDAGDVASQLGDGRANLAAGTSWLWVSPKMAGAVRTLFIDEAGQISLANAVAVASAAQNLVLLGDPQQLDQPMQGSHPPGADRSALAHVLADLATIPPDRGLFLERTWRLHPELTRFTSEVFYDDRLTSEAHLVNQRVASSEAIFDGVGPRLVDVSTAGADNESALEAEAVARLAHRLLDGHASWVDPSGLDQPLTWNDILIVAPYNAQVGAIQRLLPAEARVGTVDKFQGQQAPISIYSLTTSSPELAPRGMNFLYSRNRLNVATSRARCVAVVVASPDLLRVRARTPEQMRLANAFCRFSELAAGTHDQPASLVPHPVPTTPRRAPEPPDDPEPPRLEVLTLGLE